MHAILDRLGSNPVPSSTIRLGDVPAPNSGIDREEDPVAVIGHPAPIPHNGSGSPPDNIVGAPHGSPLQKSAGSTLFKVPSGGGPGKYVYSVCSCPCLLYTSPSPRDS